MTTLEVNEFLMYILDDKYSQHAYNANSPFTCCQRNSWDPLYLSLHAFPYLYIAENIIT